MSRDLKSLKWLPLLLIAAPTLARAQVVVVSAYDREAWFDTRWWAAVVFGLLLGGLIGALRLTRLQFHPGEFSVDSRARVEFFLWGVLALLLGGVFLLFDGWLLFVPATRIALGFLDAFWGVWFCNYTLGLVGIVAASFFFAGAITTRFVPGSRCKYALWPGPRAE